MTEHHMFCADEGTLCSFGEPEPVSVAHDAGGLAVVSSMSSGPKSFGLPGGSFGWVPGHHLAGLK